MVEHTITVYVNVDVVKRGTGRIKEVAISWDDYDRRKYQDGQTSHSDLQDLMTDAGIDTFSLSSGTHEIHVTFKIVEEGDRPRE